LVAVCIEYGYDRPFTKEGDVAVREVENIFADILDRAKALDRPMPASGSRS